MTLSNLSSNMLDAMNGTVGTPELATSTSVPSNPGHHLESLANSLLSRMNEEEKIRQIPLALFLIVLSVTGFLGNILVCFIYGRVYIFRKLPDTMRKMADRLLDSDSVQQRHTTGTLNSSRPSDLKLMGELQLIQDVINTVSNSPDMLKSKSPDLFSFTITGLNDIVKKHGGKSPQADDAQRLISDFITKMTDDFRKLYKDNVVVEVLTVNPGLGIYVRKTRSLMAVDDSNVNINLSKDYDENYPAIFNIILWLMIVMFVVIFGVSYGMWNIDPGRDSIIYRMTTTRLKKD